MCISIHIHEQYDTKQKTRGETAETNYFEVGSLPRRCRGRGGGKRAQKTPKTNTTKSWGLGRNCTSLFFRINMN
jgi:hypothetical protein